MHKMILKVFDFLNKISKFFEIYTLICITLFLLYWIEYLIGANWFWLNIMKPLFSTFVNIGALISDGGFKFFSASVEYRFLIALLLFIFLAFLFNYLAIFFEKAKLSYENLHNIVKKNKENKYNEEMENLQQKEQAKIKRYYVYISTKIKEKKSGLEKINIDEQNSILNKFLIKNTEVIPVKYNDGFLYTFERFKYIDSDLEAFFKVIKSKAPLDYIICIQIVAGNQRLEMKQLNNMINLNLTNKIITLSDTVYRYSFNEVKKYGIETVGVYQKDGQAFDVYEFKEENV